MTPPRIIIGFAGLIGCGKTTAAQHLIDKHGFVRVRFAGPLKAMALAFGLTPEQVDGDLKEKPADILCGRTPRYFMQKLGTEFGRAMIGHDVWTQAWRVACNRLPPETPIVVDDVRFKNEAEAIHSLTPFGIVVRITRESVTKQGHISEIQQFGADYRIANNGSMQDLKAAVDNLLLCKESSFGD